MAERPAEWGDIPPAVPTERTAARVPETLGDGLIQTRQALDAVAAAETPEEAARRLDAALVTLQRAQAQLPRSVPSPPSVIRDSEAARRRRRRRPSRRHRTESRFRGMFRRNKLFRALVVLLIVTVFAVVAGVVAGLVRWGGPPPYEQIVPETVYAPAQRLIGQPFTRLS